MAALFALHPLHVESVAWISERKDVLSTFFALAALWAYVRYAEVRMQHEACSMKEVAEPGQAAQFHAAFYLLPPALFLLSLSLFALSLMSKAMFVTLPALMLLLDYWPLGRFQLKPHNSTLKTLTTLLLEKVPFLALSVAATCVSVLLLSEAGAIPEVADVGLWARLARAFAAYQHYVIKTFWPSNLAMPCLRPAQWPAWEVVSAMLLVGALTLSAFWQGRRRPWLLVGWFWFLGLLVPVIGLVPFGAHAMADRYTYFPLIGVFLALTWSAADSAARWSRGRVMLGAVAGAVLLGCGVTTRAQVRYWGDSETLFRHAIAATAGNYIAHGGLGLHLFSQSKVDEAIREYEAALQINPLYDVAHGDLARALASEKRYDEAVAHFQTSLSLRPNDVKTLNNYGGVLVLQGRYEEAVRQFEAVVRQEPDHPAAHNNLAISYRKLGRVGEAITQYREAIRLQPDSAEGLNNLAWLLAACPDGRFRNGSEAVGLATRACKLTRYQNPVTLATLAAAYGEIGKFPEAVTFTERAQELAQGRQPALATRLSAMLEDFRADRPYHAD